MPSRSSLLSQSPDATHEERDARSCSEFHAAARRVTYRDQAIPVVFAREMLGIGRLYLGCVA